MNSSIYNADRATHLRIVSAALVIGIAIVGLGLTTRVSTIGGMQASGQPAQIQKAAQVSREALISRTAPGPT